MTKTHVMPLSSPQFIYINITSKFFFLIYAKKKSHQYSSQFLLTHKENSLNFTFILSFRFDEVDEANPEKKLTIHQILLKGKRGNKLSFEDELMPPRGKFFL